MNRILIALLLVCCFVVSFSGSPNANPIQTQLSQEPLTNRDIVQMVSAKIAPAVIIAKIKTSRCHFDTNPTVIAELEYQRVPESVLLAMSEAPFGAPLTPGVEVPDADVARKNTRQPGNNSSPIGDKANRVEPTRNQLPQTREVFRTEQRVTAAPANSELSDEIALGLSRRGTLLSERREIRNSKADELAQTVFSRLRTTQTVQYGPALPYRVTIIEGAPNAFAHPGGDVYVTSGLAEVLGNDPGLWAAVMGHELAHAIKQHSYRTYIREVQLRRQIEVLRIRAAGGDMAANWSLITVAIAGRLLNNKMERNDESEADKLGFEMMIEAGYHPDFAIALYRRLRAQSGDVSKFAALFSDHPRWITREERVLKLFDEGLARFESLWPDAALSPGGMPPVMATVGKISSKENKAENSVMMQIPYTVRNARNIEIYAVVYFTFKGNSVSSSLPEFQAKDGSLTPIKSFMPISANQSGSVEIIVPTAAIGIRERKLKAKLCLQKKSELLQCSKEKDVSFPKN